MGFADRSKSAGYLPLESTSMDFIANKKQSRKYYWTSCIRANTAQPITAVTVLDVISRHSDINTST